MKIVIITLLLVIGCSAQFPIPDSSVSGGSSGGGGTPGGSTGQIQYNNAGAFGGYTIVPAANIGAAGTGNQLQIRNSFTGALLGVTLSGDGTLGATGTLTVTGTNGAALPVSAAALATNSSGQIIAGAPCGTGTAQGQIAVSGASPFTGCSFGTATLSGGALTLSAAGTASSITFGNATSGTLTLQPVTGALGTVTISAPASTGTMALTNINNAFSTTQGFTSITASGTVTVNQPGIGSTPTYNIQSINSTNAAAGAQQWACGPLIQGQGWGTTAPGSQSVAFADCVQPVQGTTAPSGTRNTYAIINGTPTNVMSLTSGGALSLSDLTINGDVITSLSGNALNINTSNGLLVTGRITGGNAGLVLTNSSYITTTAGQVSLGSATAAVSNCGAVATACLVINVAGTTRYIPYY